MKTIDSIIRKSAEDLGIPEDKAKKVVMEYWSVIYKKLISGANSAVTVRHVGTFAISRYKLKIGIIKKIQKIRRIRKSTNLTTEIKEKYLESEMTKLRKALVHRNDIAIQYAKNFGNI